MWGFNLYQDSPAKDSAEVEHNAYKWFKEKTYEQGTRQRMIDYFKELDRRRDLKEIRITTAGPGGVIHYPPTRESYLIEHLQPK